MEITTSYNEQAIEDWMHEDVRALVKKAIEKYKPKNAVESMTILGILITGITGDINMRVIEEISKVQRGKEE